jgi:hypothetical protein
MPSIMSSIILGILTSGKADLAEPDARTEPPTATARAEIGWDQPGRSSYDRTHAEL